MDVDNSVGTVYGSGGGLRGAEEERELGQL